MQQLVKLLQDFFSTVPAAPKPGIDTVPSLLTVPGSTQVLTSSRRDFLKRAVQVAGIGLVGSTLPGVDLDKLLWTPGEKQIFVGADLVTGDEAVNCFIGLDMITIRMLEMLKNNLVFASNLNKAYDSTFGSTYSFQNPYA